MTIQGNVFRTVKAISLLEQVLDLADAIRNPSLEQVINLSGRLDIPDSQVLIECWPVFMINFVDVRLSKKSFV